ncbi:MAG TPA: hypothetical protein VF789_16745 [Thermoanaerobaculia bacterium]
MKSLLILALPLLLICTGAALAQTPDGETPAQEAVCDDETGAAYGLCNAYCEAMDCESDDPQASETACTRVKDKFTQITGRDLPCEEVTCPCLALPDFNAVLAGSSPVCGGAPGSIVIRTNAGRAFGDLASCGTEGGTVLDNITEQEGLACVELILTYCPSGGAS